MFERRELDRAIEGDGSVHGAVDDEFFQRRETDGEEHKRADEDEKGVDDAHTRGDRTKDAFKRAIHVLFSNILRRECTWIRGGVEGVCGEEDTVDAAQVDRRLFDEVCKSKELCLSNNRDRLQLVRFGSLVHESRHQRQRPSRPPIVHARKAVYLPADFSREAVHI